MKKLIFLLVLFLSFDIFAQDHVVLNSDEIIYGKILNDEFGAVRLVVDNEGFSDTIQILKTQISKIVYCPGAVFHRPVSIAFSPSITFFGVRRQLNDLLVTNNFDGMYDSWLFGPTTSQFPKVTSFLSLAVDGNYRVGNRLGFGLKFGLFNHILAKGYNSEKGGHVAFKYSDVGLTPYVRLFNLNNKVHLDVGPSFNLVSLKGEGTVPEVFQEGPASENRLFLGMNLGAGVAIYEKSHSYLHFNLTYQQIFGKATVNPVYYKDYLEMTSMVIPSQDIRMSQFAIGLSYGRKFRAF